MLHFALRRAQNVHWQALDVNKAARAALKGQKACVLWYTGLSGAGKSTIANLVDKKLHSLSRHTYLLDGDNVRHGLNKDLGLHRRRSRREHPPHRRGGQADGRRRAHRQHRLHLAVPRRAADGARAARRRASSSRSSSTRRSASPRSATRRGSTRRRAAATSRTSPASTRPTRRPESPEIRIDTTSISPEDAAEAIVAFLQQRGVLESD